jgi:hypothetical protein
MAPFIERLHDATLQSSDFKIEFRMANAGCLAAGKNALLKKPLSHSFLLEKMARAHSKYGKETAPATSFTR